MLREKACLYSKLFGGVFEQRLTDFSGGFVDNIEEIIEQTEKFPAAIEAIDKFLDSELLTKRVLSQDLLQWINSNVLDDLYTNREYPLIMLCKKGYVNMAKYYYDTVHTKNYKRMGLCLYDTTIKYCMQDAIDNNHLEVVEWLSEIMQNDPGFPFTISSYIFNIGRSGNIPIAKCILEKCDKLSDNNIIEFMCTTSLNRRCELLTWFLDTYKPKKVGAIYMLIYKGLLNELKIVIERIPEYKVDIKHDNYKNVYLAACNGYFDTVKYCIELFPDIPFTYNNSDLLTDACAFADIDFIKFLAQRRELVITFNTALTACRYNKYDGQNKIKMLEYLISIFPNSLQEYDYISDLYRCQDYDTLYWFVQKYPDVGLTDYTISDDIFRIIRIENKVLIKILLEKCVQQDSSDDRLHRYFEFVIRVNNTGVTKHFFRIANCDTIFKNNLSILYAGIIKANRNLDTAKFLLRKTVWTDFLRYCKDREIPPYIYNKLKKFCKKSNTHV